LPQPHLPGRQRVHVRTFGCQHNQSDGEYMLGQLREYGYELVDSLEECDACVVNSCTVKTPSESRGLSVVSKARESGKAVVLAGCVPSADRTLAARFDGVSMLHATQLHRVVEVVEEALKGNTVTLLKRSKELPSLALPKIRRDRLSEIVTINAGCLGRCTYCKTKLARGTVVSYPIDEIVARAKQAARDGVCYIELASEDMGAYGADIGTNIAELLLRLSDALPPGVMLRTGMTNPPHVLRHVRGVLEALQRPNVFAFMHIPVQSGSDPVLRAMKRDYTVAEFCELADALREAVPDVFLLTDVICGFPTETEEDWAATMDLLRKYRFQGIYGSKFFSRPGTAASLMRQPPPRVVKERYRELAEFAAPNGRNEGLLGQDVRAWFSGTEEQRGQTVGRTKCFTKVVIPRDDALLGGSATVRVQRTAVQHVEGIVVADGC